MRSIFLCTIFLIIFSFLIIPSSNSVTKHTVKSGDTLYNLSIKYNSQVNKIKKANNLKSNNLKIGKVLTIPTNAFDPDSRIYTVQKGDTLGGIAEKFNYSSRDLVSYNRLDSLLINVGQRIMIPASGEKEPQKATVVPDTEVEKEFVMVGPERPEPAGVSEKDYRPDLNTQSENSSSVTTYYVVKKGDTLSQISERLSIKTSRIKELNGLENSNISIGQKLVVTGSQPSAVTETRNTRPDSYTVKSGDTLSEIADRFDIATASLKAYNGLNSNKITVGKDLKIPAQNYTPPPDIEKAEYKVRNGDTLSSISVRYGTNISMLKRLNGLDSSKLRAGQSIYVPADGIKKDIETVNYTVQSGDTLGTIASRFGVTVASVKSLNNLHSSLIRRGQTIKIPRDGLSSKTVEKQIIHKVSSGESLYSIARKYGSTVAELKTANNMIGSNIKVNQELAVPVSENVYSKSETRSRYAEKSEDITNTKNDISDSLIEVAKKFLGAPYKFGGNSTDTGIDCSAYVKKVYSFFDVSLPRTARDIFKQGDWVTKSSLEKGDLVFFRTYAQFPSHVGIYLGNDKFIHASSASKKVTITSFKKNYYQRRYIGAKRISIDGAFFDDIADQL